MKTRKKNIWCPIFGTWIVGCPSCCKWFKECIPYRWDLRNRKTFKRE